MTVFGVRWRLYRDAEPPRGWREALILFAIFAVTLYAGVEWSRANNGTVFWTANGVLAAGLLLLPRRLGWLFAAACIALNATLNVFSGLPPIFNLAFTGLNLFVCFGAAVLVRTFAGAAMDLGRLRRFLPFVAMMGGLCLVEGFTGAVITRAFGTLDFLTIVLRWAACDATGSGVGPPKRSAASVSSSINQAPERATMAASSRSRHRSGKRSCALRHKRLSESHTTKVLSASPKVGRFVLFVHSRNASASARTSSGIEGQACSAMSSRSMP